MALIVCHSPKGGTGTTFLSAQLAIGLAQLGNEVTVLTLAPMDNLSLHFGVETSRPLPALGAPSDETVFARGIDLRSYPKAPGDPYFIPKLREHGYLEGTGERILIVDVPSGEHRLADILLPLARLRICALTTAPDCITLLPQIYDKIGEEGMKQTAFVLNKVDETRRLARHTAAFLRELCGPQLIGTVRHDESVPEALAMLQTLLRYAPQCTALADMRAITAAVVPWLGLERKSYGYTSAGYAA